MYTCVLSHFSCVRLFAILCAVAHQSPLPIGFSRQEYWSPSPGGLPNPGIEPVFFMSPALTSGFFTTIDIWEDRYKYTHKHIHSVYCVC